MNDFRKNSTKMIGAILGIMALAVLAVWQFYLFVTFKDQNGAIATQGGTSHLWWAIGMALLSCVASFVVFSAGAQHHREDDLHVISQR
jgi:hypothetical protein